MRDPRLTAALGLWLAVFLVARAPAQDAVYDWGLPPGYPAPAVPADNPMSVAKVELGRHLFYDTRLSGNGTQSCGSCHEQTKAFTDGLPRGIGSTGQMHPRSSMSLVNVGYAAVLTWADRTQTQLETQMLVPMYGTHPLELGLDPADGWLEALRTDPRYQPLFRDAFGAEASAMTRDHVIKALASFQRALVSSRSPYDRYHFRREDTAVSAAAKRGEVLFHSRPLSCFTCHGGVHFSNAMGTGRSPDVVELHNTGLYNLPGFFSYPQANAGLYDVTRERRDIGKFKVPTLRNIALTAPYMHDGSVWSLDAVIDHYAAGGRTIAEGPHRGVGRDNPNKTRSLGGFTITAAGRADLIAFLETLTDTELARDPRFANPWIARR